MIAGWSALAEPRCASRHADPMLKYSGMSHFHSGKDANLVILRALLEKSESRRCEERRDEAISWYYDVRYNNDEIASLRSQ